MDNNPSTHEGIFLADKKCFLFYDGVISSDKPTVIMDLLESGVTSSKLVCPTESRDIQQFNRFVSKDQQILKSHEITELDMDWNVPPPYDTFDIESHVEQLMIKHMSVDSEKHYRYTQEMQYFRDNNLINLLRAVYYVIEVFKQNNIVWGIGRGSSVSSYILFLLEVHDIDPIKFDLDIEDFLPLSKTINTV